MLKQRVKAHNKIALIARAKNSRLVQKTVGRTNHMVKETNPSVKKD